MAETRPRLAIAHTKRDGTVHDKGFTYGRVTRADKGWSAVHYGPEGEQTHVGDFKSQSAASVAIQKHHNGDPLGEHWEKERLFNDRRKSATPQGGEPGLTSL